LSHGLIAFYFVQRFEGSNACKKRAGTLAA
jgi:hypothetical protein